MKRREPMATPSEVAEFLAVSRGTLANWRYLGRGPQWVKIGGRVRYRWQDIEAYGERSAAA